MRQRLIARLNAICAEHNEPAPNALESDFINFNIEADLNNHTDEELLDLLQYYGMFEE